ncbi:MAG: asparagine synthase-related protein [Candidatus Hydrogenedentes bacterium]|nr:asparagine synthase-related protein [Candidatus Hydrogenedentota bacterium]
MNSICGILGKSDPAAVREMATAMAHRGQAAYVVDGQGFTVAASHPLDEEPCLIDGFPRSENGEDLGPAGLRALCLAARKPASLRLNGAYAAVVRMRGEWWLIRDRLGIKPLYYYADGGRLLFASELKALLASGYVERQINFASVDHYLALRCVPGPSTIIENVRRVTPGHAVVWSRERVSETSYAQLPGADAVFVTLKSAWQDEAWRAKESARLLKIDLKTVKAPRVSESMFAKAAYHLDEPIGDAGVLPLWMIAEQAVAAMDSGAPQTPAPAGIISAHGADEILAGYPRYRMLQQARTTRNLVPVNLLTAILPSLPPNAFVRRGGRYLSLIRDNVRAYLSLASVFDKAERHEIYTGPMREAIKDRPTVAEVIAPHFNHENAVENLLALDLHLGLPDLLLTECDRLMSAHGLELEFPYLDDDLVQFAVALPPKVKYGMQSKPLLRLAMKGRLPGRIRLRARRGFRVPQSGPSLRVIEQAARQILTRERIEESAMFRWSFVSQILSGWTHNIYRRRQFWSLLMFFAWYREFMED